MKKLLIAIDGHAGSGKSSTARRVAKLLNYKYINSGIIYRAITLFLIREKIDYIEEALIEQALKKVSIVFKFNQEDHTTHIYLDNEDVSERAYSILTENNVCKYSSLSIVRKKVNTIQKELGKDKGVVVEGRDIGTKVFPDADLKIFMTANVEERAKRRHKDINKAESINFEDLRDCIQLRDKMDQEREISPLTMAPDSVKLDTTHMNFNQQVDFIIDLVKMKLKE